MHVPCKDFLQTIVIAEIEIWKNNYFCEVIDVDAMHLYKLSFSAVMFWVIKNQSTYIAPCMVYKPL